jgi:hypothetical protein
MLFKLKRHADGSVDRRKCRLVAQGYSQRPGVDFDETFAPTARWTSIRITAAVAAAEDMSLHQLDVATAYLKAPLEEELYMRLPSGETVRLQRAIYGLKQAGRAWYLNLRASLARIGFSPSSADPSLFVSVRNGVEVLLAVYVDDMMLAAPKSVDAEEIKRELKSLYEMRDLGQVKEFLGIEFERDREKRSIFLHQSGYARSILERYGMADCASVATPMDTAKPLLPAPPSEHDECARRERASGHLYASMVGSLSYLAICTRPDLAQATSELGRFAAAPTDEHVAAVKRVLRYLKGTTTLGLLYDGKLDGERGRLIGYSDANWAGDTSTRRSRTAYCFVFQGGLVSWASKLQATVATSTAHAEYQAMSAASREGVWLLRVLGDVGRPLDGSLELRGDNLGAQAIASNPVSHTLSKHWAVQLHAIRELVDDRTVRLTYCPTREMIADALTKPLGRTAFERCRDLLGVRPRPTGAAPRAGGSSYASGSRPPTRPPGPRPSGSVVQCGLDP